MPWFISAGTVFALVFIGLRSIVIQKVIISFETFLAVFDRSTNVLPGAKLLNTYKINAPQMKQI
jgi:hypothetical protein